ncbi:MAG: methylated-DNA--[protein]-cysteine S-methyltransferase [Candidatus Zixiibacteriota bacterium]
MKKLYVHSFKTKLGTVRTAATEKGITIISLPGESRQYFEGQIEKRFADYFIYQGGLLNRKAETQIKKFIDGKLKKFTLKLDIQGSLFQKKVLKKVAMIPYGKTMTYGEIAQSVGNPLACRAVGTANAKNKLPLVIPCHRVVASNGLGGFGGGMSLKKKLLKMEGAL